MSIGPPSEEEQRRAFGHAMRTGDQSLIGECWARLGGALVGAHYFRKTKAHLGRRVNVDKLDNEARFRRAVRREKAAEEAKLGRKLTKTERGDVIERLAGKFGIDIERAHFIADGGDKTVSKRARELDAENQPVESN